MKDLPVFTTENGVAGLILREIPYTQEAYIQIRSSEAPKELLEECVSFCRMVGAERIYAKGDASLEAFPLHTAVWRMCCLREQLGETDAMVFPVCKDNAERFQALYNEKSRRIPNSAWMTDGERSEMLKLGDGYYVHRNGKLLGIGRANGESIRFLASFSPGAGEDVVKALSTVVVEDTLTLEVASENRKAVDLYERLGFIRTEELARWYRVFPQEK